MSNSTISERLAVMRERSAWIAAKRDSFCGEPSAGVEEVWRQRARVEFPLKAERPRVVNLPDCGFQYRFVRGEMQYLELDTWRRAKVQPPHVKALADLIANPVEMVEDES